MDPHSTFEGLVSPDVSPADSAQRGWPGTSSSETKPDEIRFPGEDGGKSLAEIAHRDLDAALQLLAEQAQYITGATGAAIALRDEDEMLCRASAGHSAPEVGSQLQVNSGLSGESVRSRETLRCDDAATDPRVNRESCEALGIASVVVMPLVHGDEVIGVFELFSDKTNAFETRDLVALERMGKMVFTALGHGGAHDLAGEPQQQPVDAQTGVESPAPPGSVTDSSSADATSSDSGSEGNGQTAEGEAPVTPAPAPVGADHQEVESVLEAPETLSGVAFHGNGSTDTTTIGPASDPKSQAVLPPDDNDDILGDVPQVVNAPHETSTRTQGGEGELRRGPAAASPETSEQASDRVADATPEGPTRSLVAGLKRCEACGFPVSEGRRLCLDCERKGASAPANDTVAFATKSAEPRPTEPHPSVSAGADETPQLFSNRSDEASWVASHKYMVVAVAIAVLLIILFLVAR